MDHLMARRRCRAGMAAHCIMNLAPFRAPLAPAAGWRAGSWCPVDNLHWKKQFHGGREPASAALGTEYKVPPGKAL